MIFTFGLVGTFPLRIYRTSLSLHYDIDLTLLAIRYCYFKRHIPLFPITLGFVENQILPVLNCTRAVDGAIILVSLPWDLSCERESSIPR